jgi:hypothetical protein
MNVPSLLLNNYNFSYERSLTRKISFVAGYRFMPEKNLGQIKLLKNVIEKFEGDDGSVMDDLERIETSANAVTAEFRFYGGRHPGARGFYVSVFGRYTNFKVNYDYDFETQPKNYSIPIRSKFNGLGGGLMIGVQWLIGERVTLDWNILGGFYGRLKGTATSEADLSDMSDNDKALLKEDLESLVQIGNKQYITADVNNTGVNAKISGPFVGVRGMGLSLGIAF